MTPLYVSVAALAVTVLMHFATALRASVRMAAAVEQLTTSVRELNRTVGSIRDTQAHLDKRVAVLEDRQHRAAAGVG